MPGAAQSALREVRRHAANVGVDGLVTFPGYLSGAQLAGLYERARCLVFPSLFEGFGFPVLEAFVAALPVACASATSLAELAGPAAVQFDGTDVDAIAEALREVWADDRRRAELVVMGRERASYYTWDNLARSCRALYRVAADVALDVR